MRSIFEGTFDVFEALEGHNRIRILPPTWEGARHYGVDLWLHFGVRPDKQKYLCMAKTENGGWWCRMCDEARLANSDGDVDMRPKRQVLMWVIDREDEDAGPKLYTMHWTLDRDILKLSYDEDSESCLMVEDPDDGYDLTFERKGGIGLTTEYGAVSVARKPSLISGDQKRQEEWLEFIQDNPIPQILEYEKHRQCLRKEGTS